MNVIMMITNLIAGGIDYLGQTNISYKITRVYLLNENIDCYVNCYQRSLHYKQCDGGGYLLCKIKHVRTCFLIRSCFKHDEVIE